jgi:ribosomal protein L11 methyltransferase
LGLWEEEDDAFLFFARSSDNNVASVLDTQPHLELMDRFEMSYEQWHGGPVEPLTVGALHVIPPWHPSAKDRDSNTILLDPGIVFGTGTHPTTQDCLRAVQLALTHRPVQCVIDLGTGSGLLSLAAIQMGSNACLALDLNRLAVETTWRNVILNRMCGQILVVQGDAKNFMDLPCDLMVSNIHYDVMRHIIAGKGFQVPKQFILSGLLRSQASKVEARLMSGPAKILEKWERDGIWTTFYGEIVDI